LVFRTLRLTAGLGIRLFLRIAQEVNDIHDQLMLARRGQGRFIQARDEFQLICDA
jgi:hypothetical protein